MLLTAASIQSVATAAPSTNPSRPAVLFWGADVARLQPEFARFLNAQGFEVQWGEPKPERLTAVNTLVLIRARAERHLPQVLDFVKRGGGLWIEPEIGQSAALELKQQYELLDAIQVAFYPESLVDQSKPFGPLGVNYSHTSQIGKGPVSEGVTSVWYPVGEPGGNVGTIPLGLGDGWQAVVTAEAGAKVKIVSGGGVVPPERHRSQPPSSSPLFAIRQWGSGRLAVCGIHSSFLFASGFSPALGRVTLDAGMDGKPSHLGKLVVNTLRWLAEPSLGKPGFGGATTDPKLLRETNLAEDVPPRDWSNAKFPPAKPNWHGVVGARTTRTTGKASAAEFAAAAKKAGLHFIVFLEEFSLLTRDEFESLRAECAKLSDDTFQAYPGFTIQDVFGNHYFVCGPKTVWPEKDLLDAEGKRFTDVFQGMDPKSPGTLGAVLLEYWLKRGEFILGTYLHKRNPLAYYDFRAYDSMAVVTQQDGETLESLEETHNQQHNLFVVATDVDGAQAVTTELWDRIHLFEEYMCYDRMNQLPWGQARWEDTCTQARIIPPTAATAVKGPWSSYMVSSPAGLYSTDARLVDASGKEVSAQLSAVTKHPDGSIQHAQVWFLISLKPGEVTQFKLQPGQSTAGSELKVSRVGDRVELNNGLVGARFHIGEKQLTSPVRASEVPTFLRAVQLRGGAWTGRGWFETPKRCRSYKVALVESGPVFARLPSSIASMGFAVKAATSIVGRRELRRARKFST
ncbi:MAG TPA: hypothetical protein P5525_11525 [Candidatus Paceibacterota bacterium]|nr:hypothetical protein [Candidatus Paceibacterota bacterium]